MTLGRSLAGGALFYLAARPGPLPEALLSRRSIASMYVHPPYLLDGRKLDLRLYVLVTSWRPLVCYLHEAGLARIATAKPERKCESLPDT